MSVDNPKVITDKQLMIYLNYKEIYPIDIKKEGKQVQQIYEDTEQFKQAIEYDYQKDTTFKNIMSAIKTVEETLRLKMQA